MQIRHNYCFPERKQNRKIMGWAEELASHNVCVIVRVRNIIDRTIMLPFP